jgi:hypothetical protein
MGTVLTATHVASASIATSTKTAGIHLAAKPKFGLKLPKTNDQPLAAGLQADANGASKLPAAAAHPRMKQ